MTIHIYDGMAVLRRKFENDPFGRGVRSVFVEMLTAPRCDVHIWCFEGRGSLAARRKLLPTYKDRPSTMTDGIRPMIDLVRDALKHTRAIQIAVPGREADDVIAHLCEVHGPTAKGGVRVHTVDRDLIVLQTSQVKVDVKPLKVVMDNTDHSKDVEIPPADVPLYKALVGDPSDCIPGMPKFGPKAFVAADRRLLQIAFDALCAGRPSAAAFVAAGVKEAMAERMCAPEQADLLRTYARVIDFMPLPGGWDEHVVAGTPNQTLGDELLKRFHH